jgi:hypothetical protein
MLQEAAAFWDVLPYTLVWIFRRCSTVSHRLNIVYLNLGLTLHHKHETSSTARYVEAAFVLFIFYVTLFHLFFNPNNFE